MHDEATDLDNRPSVFGDTDERAGCEFPARGVLPPDEGLSAHDRVRVEVDDGLVADADFATLQCAAQLVGQGESLNGAVVHVRVEHGDWPLPANFASYGSDVSVTFDIRWICGSVTDGDADAGADDNLATAQRHGLTEMVEHSCCDCIGVFRRACALKDDSKFVTAQPDRSIALTHALDESIGNDSQELVTCGMPEESFTF